MAKVTDQERNDIQDFLLIQGLTTSDYHITKDRITVIRDYMPDGPSWIGDIFFIVWGEANFITIVGRKSESSDYELMYDIDDAGLMGVGWAGEEA